MKKRLAHEYFDSLHDFNPALRRKAYEILAERMATYAGFSPLLQEKYQANLQGMQNGKEGIAHIRYFNEIECEVVIEIVKALYWEVGITIDTVGSITPLAKSAVKPLILNHLSLAKFLISPQPEAKPMFPTILQPIETSIANLPLPMGEEEKAQFMSQRLITIQTKMVKGELLTEAEQMLWYGVKEQFYDYDHSGIAKTDIEIISACYQNAAFLKEITELYPELVSEYQKELALKKEAQLLENSLTPSIASVVEVKKSKTHRPRKSQKITWVIPEDTKKVQHSIQAFNREVQHQVEKEAQLRLAREAEAKAAKERLEASLRKQENPPIVLKEEEVLRDKRNQYFRSILGYSEEQLLQERTKLEEDQDLEEQLRTQFLQIVVNQLKLKYESKLKQESLIKEKKLAHIERQNQKLAIKKECEKVRQEIEWLLMVILAEGHLTNMDFLRWFHKDQPLSQHSQLIFKKLCMMISKEYIFDIDVFEQVKHGSLAVNITFTSCFKESRNTIKIAINQQKLLANDRGVMAAFNVGKFFKWLGITENLNEVELTRGMIKFSLGTPQRIKLQKYYIDSLFSFMQTLWALEVTEEVLVSISAILKKFDKLAFMYQSSSNKPIIALLDEPLSMAKILADKIAAMQGVSLIGLRGEDGGEEIKIECFGDISKKDNAMHFMNSDDFAHITSAMVTKTYHFSPRMLVMVGSEHFLSQSFSPFNQTLLPINLSKLPSKEGIDKKVSFSENTYVPFVTCNPLKMFLLVKSAFPDDQKPSVDEFNQLLVKFFDPAGQSSYCYAGQRQLKKAITEFKRTLVGALKNIEDSGIILDEVMKDRKLRYSATELTSYGSKVPFAGEIYLFTSMLLNMDKAILIELCQQKSQARGI